MLKKYKSYLIAILIPLLVGVTSAISTIGNMNLEEKFKMPPLAQQAIIFPIVWTLLYILMGVSSGIVFNSNSANESSKITALFIYALSLVFNFFWSIIFFNINAFLFAFIWLIVLWILILNTIIKYYKISKIAAYLQLPYLLWVTFAGYLNFAIWYLNR